MCFFRSIIFVLLLSYLSQNIYINIFTKKYQQSSSSFPYKVALRTIVLTNRKTLNFSKTHKSSTLFSISNHLTSNSEDSFPSYFSLHPVSYSQNRGIPGQRHSYSFVKFRLSYLQNCHSSFPWRRGKSSRRSYFAMSLFPPCTESL